MRDSAGVRIVESRSAKWNAETSWTISEEPIVVIGRAGSGEDLFNVRGATRLKGGRIVIANHGTSDWAVFDPAGQWLGEVETPRGGRIWEIGSDDLLGTRRDELDVEEVRMYGILKPGG
ncbi:MAG: hypothetical protein P8170_09690 [Gemmatimonadota bacterium]